MTTPNIPTLYFTKENLSFFNILTAGIATHELWYLQVKNKK